MVRCHYRSGIFGTYRTNTTSDTFLFIPLHLLTIWSSQLKLYLTSWFLLSRNHPINLYLLFFNIKRIQYFTQINQIFPTLFRRPIRIQYNLYFRLFLPKFFLFTIKQNSRFITKTFLKCHLTLWGLKFNWILTFYSLFSSCPNYFCFKWQAWIHI